MSALGRLWERLWLSPASPYPQAAFRILLGGYLCVYFGTLAPHVPTLFSSEGVYAPYLVADYAPPPPLAWVAFALLWLCSFALLLGYRAGLVIPCLLGLYAHHYFLFLAVKHSSFERLIAIYLLALWPAQCDSVWALSAPRTAQPPAATVFAARLLRFQTIVLYLGAGLWKAAAPAWRSGVLLLSTMQGVWATPLAFGLVRAAPSLAFWQALSYAVFCGEVLLAALLFFRRTRPVGIVCGVVFHVANSVVLAIPEFLLCVAPYVFFVREAIWDALASRISARLKPRSRANE